MTWVALDIQSAATVRKCQWISQHLESGHPGFIQLSMCGFLWWSVWHQFQGRFKWFVAYETDKQMITSLIEVSEWFVDEFGTISFRFCEKLVRPLLQFFLVNGYVLPACYWWLSSFNLCYRKFWTRNRLGDSMRDRYNLNTLPFGISDDTLDGMAFSLWRCQLRSN